MAQMYPPEFPPFDASDKRWAEEQFYNYCKTLDDDWLVIHSVPWQGKRKKFQGDGELDFLLIHPRLGIYGMEVKGGLDFKIEGEKWFSIDGRGAHENEDPFKQGEYAVRAIVKFLKEVCPHVKLDNIRSGHGVVFPSYEYSSPKFLHGPVGIVIDKVRINNAGAMERVAAHWRQGFEGGILSPSEMKQIREAILPSLTIPKAGPSERVAANLEAATTSQILAIQGLARIKRTYVVGRAGTGKTVLARERAKQLSNAGLRTLLLCFNRPLGELLKTYFEFGDLVTVGSFHSFALDIATRTGGIPGGELTEELWDEQLPEALIHGAKKLELTYDAIIVDEAQDFKELWWVALSELEPKDGSGILQVFADPLQNVYQEQNFIPFDEPSYYLSTNCRNTKNIASVFAPLVGDDDFVLGAAGPTPTCKPISTPRQREKSIVASLERLINENRLAPSQIVIIVDSPQLRAELNDWLALSDNQPRFNGIKVETLARFKGLESEAVVAVFEDHQAEEYVIKRNFYLAFSRAKIFLDIIVDEQILAVVPIPEIEL